MKIIFFFYLIIKFILCCDPINVYTNVYPNNITETNYINRGIRIGFISKTKCPHGFIVLKQFDENNQQVQSLPVSFVLVSITVSKFIIDDTYQVFYSYHGLISVDYVKRLGFKSFHYDIKYQDEETQEMLKKSFQFKSNFNLDESLSFKFAVIGNLKKQYIPKLIKTWEERGIDVLVLLGNMSEDWYNKGGYQFDEYFQMLEPITSKVPFYFIQGFYERAGTFNGPLSNRFLQTFPSTQLDNYFSSIQYGKLRLNFFALNIIQIVPQKDILLNFIKNQLESKDYGQNQIAIFSSYSLNCINNTKNEVCSERNSVAIKPLELFLSQIRVRALISSGYPVYQYFQMKTFQTDNHFLSNYWDNTQYNPFNYIVGTGGNNRDPLFDKDKSYKDDKMGITNLVNELGYLEIDFEEPSLEKIKTAFISLQQNGRVFEKDQRNSSYNTFFTTMSSGVKHFLELGLKLENQKKVQNKVEQFESMSDQEVFSDEDELNTLRPKEDDQDENQNTDT